MFAIQHSMVYNFSIKLPFCQGVGKFLKNLSYHDNLLYVFLLVMKSIMFYRKIYSLFLQKTIGKKASLIVFRAILALTLITLNTLANVAWYIS